jgi:hypothetical protein
MSDLDEVRADIKATKDKINKAEVEGRYEYATELARGLTELRKKENLLRQPSAGKFTFQSHFSPAINFKYLFFILFDMLSPFISCCDLVPVIFEWLPLGILI